MASCLINADRLIHRTFSAILVPANAVNSNLYFAIEIFALVAAIFYLSTMRLNNIEYFYGVTSPAAEQQCTILSPPTASGVFRLPMSYHFHCLHNRLFRRLIFTEESWYIINISIHAWWLNVPTWIHCLLSCDIKLICHILWYYSYSNNRIWTYIINSILCTRRTPCCGCN